MKKKQFKLVSVINENEELDLQLNFSLITHRSLKTLDINIYLTNDTFNNLFQYNLIKIQNTFPRKLFNISLKTNTYYTSDRAIYTLKFSTYLNNILETNYLEYETSWEYKYYSNIL